MKPVRQLLVEKAPMGIRAGDLYLKLACGHHQWGDPFGREGKYTVNKTKITCGPCTRAKEHDNH